MAPETPGSIHEGGELGYALSHAYGAAFDNPDLIVACIVGDGEAETGPLATSWHSNKFLNPVGDGAVLPILHLNGYKIANPTVLNRIPTEELLALMKGYGHEPFLVEGDDPAAMHRQLAATLDVCLDRISAIQRDHREGGAAGRPTWPMIIFRSPKGWTGPEKIDGKLVEGYWRSHQVPFSDTRQNPAHLEELHRWLLSYQPEELFDSGGRPIPEIADLHPEGERRMSANPHANGGGLRRPLRMPDFRDYEVKIDKPGQTVAAATRVMGTFLRDVIKLNEDARNFRLFSPDENNSNRWQDVLEVTNRAWLAEIYDYDDHLAADGRVMEILSEHTIQGWLEGYLLTGRHGFLSTYEAFIHLVDSMFNQHAKWLKVTNGIEWRRPISSLNYLLSSHVWRQDHNGFSHQDPGFIDHVMNKKAEIVRVYLPPDANTLLSTTDHCLRSRQYVNVVVAGKQPAPQYLTMDEAIKHCTKGIGIWDWASSDQDRPTDLVMAAAGDVPTMEALAATEFLQQHFPDLGIRFINVVDIMRLQDDREHPHGLSDAQFVSLFTPHAPIVFAYHGYPWLIHRLTYRRSNHDHIHVRGYKEEGTTTTPFDMCVLNELDRFSLAIDAIDRVPQLGRVRLTYDKSWWTRSSNTSTTSAVTARTCQRSLGGCGKCRQMRSRLRRPVSKEPWRLPATTCKPPQRPAPTRSTGIRCSGSELLAHRAFGAAALVVTRRGKNASARSSSVRRRAIADARSLLRHFALFCGPVDIAEREARAAQAEQFVRTTLVERGVSMVATTFVDNSGITRVKSVPMSRLPHLAAWGVGASTSFDYFRFDDWLAAPPGGTAPVGDLRVVPDLGRLVPLAAQPGWAWTPGDRYRQDGEPHDRCNRLLLRRLVDHAAAQRPRDQGCLRDRMGDLGGRWRRFHLRGSRSRIRHVPAGGRVRLRPRSHRGTERGSDQGRAIPSRVRSRAARDICCG